MNSRVIEVTAPSRLHFGMFSFGQPGERQFGGVGAMIDEPGVRLEVAEGQQFEVQGPQCERAAEFARHVFAHWGLAKEPGCRIRVVSAPRQHVGLGTGTQLAMSVAVGLHTFFDRAGSATELAQSVGRGQRSAIGLHGFASGGLLVEAGKRRPEEISPLVARIDLPAAWRFVLVCPRRETGLFGPQERMAFERLPPVPLAVTNELCRLAMLHLLPAARCTEFDDFSRALYRFGEAAGLCFAAEQAGAFATARLASLVDRIRAQGIEGVGQSSWGPTLFALLSDQAAAESFAAWLASSDVGDELEITIARPNNIGAAVRQVFRPADG
jgi:beta-ribofuranosylaminobenzene 5'-phosphate synthase